jgi:signal transduction histidine kinase
LQPAPVGTRPRVLIVDDLPQNLLAFEAVIESLDVEIVKVASGEAALLQVLKGDFAVILLDVQMPGLSGLETAELIKQRENSRHIPIILVTAISRELAYIFKGYESGVVDYLLKPIDGNILRSKVSVFVELWRRGEALRQQAILVGEVKAKEAFLNVVAHELRTPLTTAKAQTQLVLRRLGDTDPATVQALSMVTRQVDRLVRLVDDLIDADVVAEGRMSLEPMEFDLCALLQEQRQSMEVLSGGAHQFRITAPTSLPIVADRSRLEQVLTNLLSNSIRYSPKGGFIDVVAEADGGLLHLSVRDHGVGIPPDKQSLLFKRFGRAHGASFGGIGLGLAISRGIVEQHGGKIWVESTGVDGDGCTFRVEIPMSPPKAATPDTDPLKAATHKADPLKAARS